MASTTLIEAIDSTSYSGNVLLDKGVIRHVKILGWKSANGREYDRRLGKKLCKLYEGVPVFINHPSHAKESRDWKDKVGCIEKPYLKDDGVYGTIRLILSHPWAKPILEAASFMPQNLQLSHNAKGLVKRKNGIDLVEDVLSVRSVDIVCEGATTESLYESKRHKMKFKDLLENISCHKNTPRKVRARIINILEEGEIKPDPTLDAEMPAEMPVDMPMEADPMQLLDDGFNAALSALVADKSLSVKDKLGKLKELLTAQEKLVSGGEAPMDPEVPTSAPVEEEDESEEMEDDKEEGEEKKEDVEEEIGIPDKKLMEEIVSLVGLEPSQDLMESIEGMRLPKLLKHIRYLKSISVKDLTEARKSSSPAKSVGAKPVKTEVKFSRESLLQEVFGGKINAN